MKLAWMLASGVAVLPVLSLPLHSNPHDQFALQQAVANDKSSISESELGGIYACEGLRPDGVSYRGTVRMIRHNGTYDLLWSVGDEEQEQYLGIGILTDGVLSVSYFGGTTGLVVYRVEQTGKGQKLVGSWTVPEADGKVAAEILTRVSKDLTSPQTRPLPNPQPTRRVLPLRNLRPA